MTKNIPVETFKRKGEIFLNGEILNRAMIINVDNDQIQGKKIKIDILISILRLYLYMIIYIAVQNNMGLGFEPGT